MANDLQRELKQSKPFPDLESEALAGILRTAAVLEHLLGEAFKPFGITPTQYNVLRILRGAEPAGLCGREVGARLISQVPDVSRLLERMADLGLVRRQRDAGDRRHVTARITAEGLALIDRVDPTLHEFQQRRLGRLGRAELEALIATLSHARAGR